MRRSPAVLALFAAIAACDNNLAAPSPQPTLLTDSASYTAIPIGASQVIVKVVTRFTNPTAKSDTLARCFPTSPHPIFSVSLVSPANTEGAAYNPAWACVGHDNDIVVGAGETRVDTLTLHGPNAYDNSTERYLGSLEGTFRINYGGAASNTFTVKLPPGGAVPFVARDLSAAIQTDSVLVHLKLAGNVLYEATTPIHATIFNPRPDTSFMLTCDGSGPFILEKLIGGQWASAWEGAFPACLSVIAIPPQGHHDIAIPFLGAKRGTNAVPRFTIDDIPGVYRITWTSIVDSWTTTPRPTSGAPIAVEYRRSNPFAIVVDP